MEQNQLPVCHLQGWHVHVMLLDLINPTTELHSSAYMNVGQQLPLFCLCPKIRMFHDAITKKDSWATAEESKHILQNIC